MPPQSMTPFPMPVLRRRATRAALVLAILSCAAIPATARADVGGAEAGVTVARAAKPASVRSTPTAAPMTHRALVVAVQERLHQEADGSFGPLTRAAVRRFQRRHHLRVDGRLTRATLAALGLAAKAASTPADAATILETIARCESGGDPARVSANGKFRGKYQFVAETWVAIGGAGDPAAAPEAEQDQRAATLYAEQGTKPWPVCGRQALAGR